MGGVTKASTKEGASGDRDAKKGDGKEDAGDKPIPIPGCKFTTPVLPPTRWKRQKEYVKYKARTKEQIDAKLMYELEFEDEMWLKRHNDDPSSKMHPITVYDFELVVDRLEKESWKIGKGLATVDQVKDKLLKDPNGKLTLGNIINVYNYWSDKRKSRRQFLIREFWRAPSHSNRDVQHVAFRPRTEKSGAQLKRDRGSDAKLYEKLKLVKDNLVLAKGIFEKIVKREKLKLTRVNLAIKVLHARATAAKAAAVAAAKANKINYPWEMKPPTMKQARHLVDCILQAKKKAMMKKPSKKAEGSSTTHAGHAHAKGSKAQSNASASKAKSSSVHAASKGQIGSGVNGKAVHGTSTSINGQARGSFSQMRPQYPTPSSTSHLAGATQVGRPVITSPNGTVHAVQNSSGGSGQRGGPKKRAGDSVVQGSPAKKARVGGAAASTSPIARPTSVLVGGNGTNHL
mmetsp:Transcript_252/g.308  ORF Transcript_252/g.308 Transcript_252/m.308 type:complete len:458 (-) Transcript_252:608-1981(-)|eukprot:CAMPEP_0113883908 /NCGR_PEP_ID=MMETSP0780_2-20120614/9900_1 /TAXON_ID=652834 /ORGANISM="Palpitomonas bilix" /LENGTH=457 /DNA_ID=CAMNT_0000871343 /DNA_START=356 /DNA_END=1729 /DNA_ORIENTATION=- /assembly_acc=CAM_ASM_000599